MVGIAIEEGGQKAEEFALLDDLGLFGKYWRPKGREGDTLKLNKPVEVVSTKGSLSFRETFSVGKGHHKLLNTAQTPAQQSPVKTLMQSQKTSKAST